MAIEGDSMLVELSAVSASQHSITLRYCARSLRAATVKKIYRDSSTHCVM